MENVLDIRGREARKKFVGEHTVVPIFNKFLDEFEEISFIQPSI
jgi:hypothetical protein